MMAAYIINCVNVALLEQNSFRKNRDVGEQTAVRARDSNPCRRRAQQNAWSSIPLSLQKDLALTHFSVFAEADGQN